MLNLTQIHPLTDFLRNHKKHIARLKKTRDPEILTVNGKAEIVIVDAESYQLMMKRLEQIETIEAINEGLRAVKAGKTKPAEQVLRELRSKHGISD